MVTPPPHTHHISFLFHIFAPFPHQQLDITFRRDPTNFRPRINKKNSQNDQEQKKNGTFYYAED